MWKYVFYQIWSIYYKIYKYLFIFYLFIFYTYWTIYVIRVSLLNGFSFFYCYKFNQRLWTKFVLYIFIFSINAFYVLLYDKIVIHPLLKCLRMALTCSRNISHIKTDLEQVPLERLGWEWIIMKKKKSHTLGLWQWRGSGRQWLCRGSRPARRGTSNRTPPHPPIKITTQDRIGIL